MTQTYRNLCLIGAGAVTLATLVVSSVHLYLVSVTAGAGWLAFLTPVAVDGLGLTAAVSLWSARRNGEEASASAVLALLLSLAASIGGNLLYPFLSELSEAQVRVLSAIVAVYPAVALAVSVELVLAAVRTEPDTEQSHAYACSESMTETETVTVTEVTEPVSPLELLRQALTEVPDASSTVLAERVGRSASWCRTKRREMIEQ